MYQENLSDILYKQLSHVYNRQNVIIWKQEVCRAYHCHLCEVTEKQNFYGRTRLQIAKVNSTRRKIIISKEPKIVHVALD
jgi:hypothetical protein